MLERAINCATKRDGRLYITSYITSSHGEEPDLRRNPEHVGYLPRIFFGLQRTRNIIRLLPNPAKLQGNKTGPFHSNSRTSSSSRTSSKTLVMEGTDVSVSPTSEFLLIQSCIFTVAAEA